MAYTSAYYVTTDKNISGNSTSKEFTSIDSVPVVETRPPKIKYEQNSKGLQLSPFAWAALVLMSAVGIIAVFLHFELNRHNPVIVRKKAPSTTKAANPIPKKQIHQQSEKRVDSSQINQMNSNGFSKPKEKTPLKRESNSFTNNIELIAKNCARMVTHQNSYAVFEHGTCVLIIEPLDDPVVAAHSTLKLLADPNMDFEVEPLNNNNYLITFNKYLFCWFSADQLAKNKDAIMLDKRLARRVNDPARLKDLTELELRIGKLARLCLLGDSLKLNVKKIIRAKQTAKQTPIQPSATPST